jgi:hypothetical protein
MLGDDTIVDKSGIKLPMGGDTHHASGGKDASLYWRGVSGE